MNGAALALSVAAVITGVGDIRAIETAGEVRWVGTTGGLVRIEGDSQRTLTPFDGLPDGTVRSLLVVGEELLVGTDRGLAVLDAEDGRLLRNLAAGHRITSLTVHHEVLFFGTDRGVYRVQENAVEEVDALGHVRDLASLPDGLYVATATRGTRRCEVVGQRSEGSRRCRRLYGHRMVWDLATDGTAVWAVTSEGLERFVQGRRRYARELPAAKRLVAHGIRVATVAEGRLLLGGVGGAWRFDGRRFQSVADTGARIVQVLGTSDDLVLGTNDGLRLGETSNTRWLLDGGLPSNDLTSIARTSEGLFIGTFRHGLVLLRDDGSVTTFDERHGLVDSRVNRLAVLGDKLWIATDRGVATRSHGRFQMAGLLGRHVSFVEVADASVYAGAGDDVFVHTDRGFIRVEQPGGRVQDLVGGSRLSIGSAEGLAVRGRNGTFELATSDGTLPDDWVTAVEYVDGSLFVGTYNAGVTRIEQNVASVAVPDVWVNAGAMRAVGRVLLVGTLDEGLVQLGTDGPTFLTTADGLPDNDVTSVFAEPDGTVWIATRGGLARLSRSIL